MDRTGQINKFWLIGIVALLLAILLAVTNPDKEMHQDVIKEAIREKHPILSLLGAASYGAEMVSYNNYIIFSNTTITFEGETEMVSVGLLGNVWLDKDEEKE